MAHDWDPGPLPRIEYAERPYIKTERVVRVEVGGPPGTQTKLIDWLSDQDIWTAVTGGQSGGAKFVGFFSPDDAQKIAAWAARNICGGE
ncbi:MAG: hypothetical protein ACLFVJ_07305 [Persicimonas sp.]